MKALFRILSLVCWCAAAVTIQAQRETLAVGAVKLTPAVATKLSNARKTLSAEQMSQSLMEQFINSVNATRKFQVVVRGDLKDLVADDDVLRAFLTSAGWAPDGASRELADDTGATVKQVRLHTALT